MELFSIPLALIAGLFSILSPCVLPLLPIVLGAAVSEHRYGPAALAGGLALSFTAIGMFVATVGYAIGLDGEVFRKVAAVLLVAVGAVLVVPNWQAQVALAAGPIANWTEQKFASGRSGGLGGQFGVGVLLGAVWSPCVGPTLGAASVLAAQGRELGHVAMTMFAFGIGSALPLLLVGVLSRESLMRWRGRMLSFGNGGKAILGGVLIASGLLILFGLDRALETELVQVLPSFMADWAGRF
ncbi:cytochrome c biogenesis CcdA family protein [Bradyrhizobium sp. USDA 3650]